MKGYFKCRLITQSVLPVMQVNVLTKSEHGYCWPCDNTTLLVNIGSKCIKYPVNACLINPTYKHSSRDRTSVGKLL